MAPKQIKRQAKADAAPALKRAKSDAMKMVKKNPALDAVADGIFQVEGLNDHCRKMLLTAMPTSLAISADERHRSQSMLVDMIGEALQSVEASLQVAADVEASRVVAIESSKPSLDEDLTSKKAALTAAAQLCESNTVKLADAAKILVTAKSILSEKLEAQGTCDAVLSRAKDSKDEVDTAIETHWKVISEGQSEEAQKQHYKVLMPLLSMLSLEDSLVTALPGTCAKLKANRGAFDFMALEQLEAILMGKAAELAKVFEEGPSSAQAHVAAVEEARREVEAAGERQKQMGEALDSSVMSRRGVEFHAEAAHVALVSHEVGCQKAIEARDAKANALKHFQEYNMASFNMLKSKSSKQPAEVTPIEASGGG